mgnify:CR=1 FL=1
MPFLALPKCGRNEVACPRQQHVFGWDGVEVQSIPAQDRSLFRLAHQRQQLADQLAREAGEAGFAFRSTVIEGSTRARYLPGRKREARQVSFS